MIWARFEATGPGKLTLIETKMNSALYQHIEVQMQDKSLQQHTLGQNCVMQQDNEPKHSSKSTSERLKKENPRYYHGQVKDQTSTPQGDCGGILREL